MTQEVKIIGGIGILSLIILFAGVFFFSGKEDAVKAQEASDVSILTRNNIHKISTETDTVSIIEFADFQCPACAMANPSIKKILSEYKGKVSFAFRHFPLPQHRNAVIAARAAESAGEQGKFFEMAETLYINQERWAESREPREIFINLAHDLGLNEDKFLKDMESGKYDKRIEEDKYDGIRLGINSTPTLFINNMRLTEAPTYKNIKARIDAELRK